jgi:hypothetical protein
LILLKPRPNVWVISFSPLAWFAAERPSAISLRLMGSMIARTREFGLQLRAEFSRILWLILLAPDMIEAILYERHSSAMPLALLMRPSAVRWDAQQVGIGL